MSRPLKKNLFQRNSYLLVFLILILSNPLCVYATSLVEEYKKNDQDFEKRTMFTPTQDYIEKNQLLVIKSLSGVLEYSGRDVLVVELIDGSEVPFYRSTGTNSGLPETWLPFFGLGKSYVANLGYIDKLKKNYSFNSQYKTDEPLNPLYHSGDYILAEVGNELDRLNIFEGRGADIRNEEGRMAWGKTINRWIGGEPLDNSIIADDQFLCKNLRAAFPIDQKNISDRSYLNLDYIKKADRLKSFRNSSKERQTVVGCAAFLSNGITSKRTLALLKTFTFINEMTNAKDFIHDVKTLHQRMDLHGGDPYEKEYEAFLIQIRECASLHDAYLRSLTNLKVHLRAYLALQMLKRFNFNYTYKMLDEFSKNSVVAQDHQLLKSVSGRAVWITVKQTNSFGEKEKEKKLRYILWKILRANSPWFEVAFGEKPAEMFHFMKEENITGTENEEDVINDNLLKVLRKISFEIYGSYERELYNIERVIKKTHHTKSFHELLEHYSQPSCLFGPNMSDLLGKVATEKSKLLLGEFQDSIGKKNIKRALGKVDDVRYLLFYLTLPQFSTELQGLNLKNIGNYLVAMKKLQLINNFLISNEITEETGITRYTEEEKKNDILALQQLTTVLYMDALAKISELKPKES